MLALESVTFKVLKVLGKSGRKTFDLSPLFSIEECLLADHGLFPQRGSSTVIGKDPLNLPCTDS